MDIHTSNLLREYKSRKTGVQLNNIKMDPFGYADRHPPSHYLVRDHELPALTIDYINRQVEAWSWVANDHDTCADTPHTRDDSFGYPTYREPDGCWRRHSRARANRREQLCYDKCKELVAERIRVHGVYLDDVPLPLVEPGEELVPSTILSTVTSLPPSTPASSMTAGDLTINREQEDEESATDFRPAFVPGPEHPRVGWTVIRRSEPYSFKIPFEDRSRGPVPYIHFVINQREQPAALGTEGKGKPQYYKPLYLIPMPAREAGTPTGHSLALFLEGHTAHHEVDCALTLVTDLGAAADVHQFRHSMR
ncbi:hypothetical protein EDB87DRAFT_1683403 [Lactarius vividus]|nr:hypothetical protein EDB87DRAFT_1683403 [Lactarius vividus]